MREGYRQFDHHKTILITGSAGFIGFYLAKELLKSGCSVIGYDNINTYYDVNLKRDRLSMLQKYENYHFVQANLADSIKLENIFLEYSPQIVINLAAQAGVRYSIQNPAAYMESNMTGFFNLLEECRKSKEKGRVPVEHLIFASSSSVYGNQKRVPFSVDDKADQPFSFYAATKRSNELMAYAYCHIYNIPSTGLRFFTVYGPYGRPDMAYFSFTKKILAGEPIQLFNEGDLYRDFTFIEDIIFSIKMILNNPPLSNSTGDQYKVYNIGNNRPVKLIRFIEVLEEKIGKCAKKEYLPMQAGDVYQTYADVQELIDDFEYKPETNIEKGLEQFVNWYRWYYK